MTQEPKADQKKIDADEDTEQVPESSYYYDDAHGYDDFDPEKEDDESEPDD